MGLVLLSPKVMHRVALKGICNGIFLELFANSVELKISNL